MSKSFEAVIYDMDGVLMDSEPLWRTAEIKVFGSVGLRLTQQDCMQTTGMRFDEVVEHWWRKHPWQDKAKQQIHDEVLDEMETAIHQQVVAMKGVTTSLELFKSKGMRLALASSSAMRLIKATVKKLKIEHYFELLVSAEHERYGKPHPAVFLRTAETLNISPANCLVIEDSLAGVLAAKAAKMTCVAIPATEDYNNPRFAIADWKLKSLDEVGVVMGE